MGRLYLVNKYRYAQLLYGKVIYIYETELKKEDLSTIFSPDIYWIDVTGQDCKVGYISEFKEGLGVVFVPPKEETQQIIQHENISPMLLSLANAVAEQENRLLILENKEKENVK